MIIKIQKEEKKNIVYLSDELDRKQKSKRKKYKKNEQKKKNNMYHFLISSYLALY